MVRKCTKCQKSMKYLLNTSISNTPLCKKCNICANCVKKNNSKSDICIKCCVKCKRCEKKLLLDDWPETIISKNGLCEKCTHLCKFCNKYLDDKKAIIRFTKKGTPIRYCEDCLRNKREPKDNNYQYDILVKDDNVHVGWKKIMKAISCENCNKKIWVKYKSDQSKCNKCMGWGKKKDKLVNPSNDNKKYKLVNNSWKLGEVKGKCKKCLLPFWIKKDNVKYGKLMRLCQNCNPSNDTKKYKYDKKKQIWIFYRERVACDKCQNVKWIFLDLDNKSIRICKKCSSSKT